MTSALSRRSFLQGSALLAGAGIAGLPALSRADAARPAPAAGTIVDISANEHPDGPPPAALAALHQIAPRGNRYLYGVTFELAQEITTREGIPFDSIMIYPGSTAPLDYTVLAFTSPEKSLVTSLPSYEQGWRTAARNRAQVFKLMQRPDYSHDVEAMCAADPDAGMIYICNPCNPTGALTSRAAIEYALAHKPAGSVLVVDEAYIHFSDNAVSALDLVARGEDVVVLRTFSKLYGMAGLRLGYAAARPDLLARLKHFGISAVPVTASAAGLAVVRDPDLVPSRRAETRALREDVVGWLRGKGYGCSASEANCFMLDVRQPAQTFIELMASHGVNVGRSWDGFPTQSRITVGNAADMARFRAAFEQVEAGRAGTFPKQERLRLSELDRHADGVLLA